MSNDHDPESQEDHTPVKTILVVEDDTAIGSFLVEAIKQEASHQALLATDGYQALKMVHDLKPSLFLIDYSLPYLNGLELYEQLHATKKLEHVRTSIMSGSSLCQGGQNTKIPCMRKHIKP